MEEKRMLFVKDILTQKVRTVDPNKTVREAAALMLRLKVGSLVIVKNEEPVGIVTEGDISKELARGADPDKTLVRRVMSKKLVTTSPDARVEEAARLMADAGIRKLPVLEDGKLVGIITQTDIVGSSFDLITALKEMVRARYRPPDFQP